MERNFDVSLYIGEDNAKKLGISEETEFAAYYQDGEIVVVALMDEEETHEETESVYEDELDDEESEYIECTEEDCKDCEYCCPYCGNCILDESEEEI